LKIRGCGLLITTSRTRKALDVYAGRGLLIESTSGKIWLVGTAVEHHTLYQYNLYNTQNVYMGFIQTETPYYQPNPVAPAPFGTSGTLASDPNFSSDCKGVSLPGSPQCAMAYGLRMVGSSNVIVFGAGLYSFFNNWSTSCSTTSSGENCQARILVETNCNNVAINGLNTIGSVSMFTRNGKDLTLYSQNLNTFAQTLAVVIY